MGLPVITAALIRYFQVLLEFYRLACVISGHEQLFKDHASLLQKIRKLLFGNHNDLFTSQLSILFFEMEKIPRLSNLRVIGLATNFLTFSL